MKKYIKPKNKINKFTIILILLIFILSLLSLYLFKTYKSIFTKSTEFDTNLNHVPYISTYYIKPIVSPKDDVIIDFYVTDYNHKEYVAEDKSEEFTLTLKSEGKKTLVKKNIKAGDNSINIGKFKELGEKKFSIFATDKYGRNSHELFNFFLVQDKQSVKSYTMTNADLNKYNIKNNDNYEKKQIVTLKLNSPTNDDVSLKLNDASTKIIPKPNGYTTIIADTIGNGEPGNWWGETIIKYGEKYNKTSVLEESKNTRIGIQKLLDDKKSEGYTTLKLLPGIYRIDHVEPIYIPTEFTLDMNDSTLKLNQFTGDKSLMIDLNNTFNSHVINGTIEGDYYSHDYKNSPNNSEWVNGINIGGESKYSSFDNLVVKDITGYGGSNGIANSRDKTLRYTYLQPTDIGDTFKLGDIDRTNGSDIKSKDRTTSDFIDIKGYADIGYLSVSKYLGYQGNSSATWNLVCNFYDENKNFIESVDSYQYRRVGVPSNASFMRVTILNEDYPKDLSVQLFRVPTHSAFKSVKFENCRAVGLAQAAMKDMLVENCEFTNSGQTLAKCAYDAEDGWDTMQDVTFRGLNFHDNPNNDFLTCAGHNFIVEDMVAGNVYFWERTNSYVVRNSNNINTANLGHGSRQRTGYSRFYNNQITSNIKIDSPEENAWPMVVKDTKITGSAENKIETGLYIRCQIGSNNESSNSITSLGEGNFKDSYIYNKKGENHGGVYDNCTFENISGNMHGTFDISNSTITNWNCYAGSYDPTYKFKNSNLNNFQILFDYWYQGADTLFDNCTIKNEDFLLKLPHYAMKKPINIINSTFTSNGTVGMINFYDDRTGGSAGNLTTQETITIKNNTIDLVNSQYIITGLTNTTENNINIKSQNNKYVSPNSLLCDPQSYKCNNIHIYEKN